MLVAITRRVRTGGRGPTQCSPPDEGSDDSPSPMRPWSRGCSNGSPVRLQYLVRVGPDLGLEVKVSDPDINVEVGSPIKVTSNEEVRLEVIFVALAGTGGVSVTLGRPHACRAVPSAKVAVWSDKWFAANLGGKAG